MGMLVAGLVVFLGTHLFTAARGNRRAVIAKVGEGPYKGIYSLASLVGFVLIVIGFGRYRAGGYVHVWEPPVFTRHLALPLVWGAFVLFTATYVPSRIKAAVGHPMVTGVILWSAAHLAANGDLGSVLLFGSFLVWAIVSRVSVTRRDDAPAPKPAPAGWRNDAVVVVAGTGAYAAFVFWLHLALIGVPVLPPR